MGARVLLCGQDCLLIFTSLCCGGEEWEGEEEGEDDK